MANVYVAAAREAWQPIFGAEILAALEPPVEHLRARIPGGGSHEGLLVAEADGAVRGYAIVRPSGDGDAVPGRDGELDAFYTHPAVWGRGVGRTLLASAAGALRDRAFTEATLWTAEDNRRPRRIYDAAGWSLDGETRERTWQGVSFREVRYRLALHDAG